MKNGTKKVLFVVTSHGQLGDTGRKTGFYLSEVTHPWKVLHDAGYTIDFASPQGGNPPVEGDDMADPVNKEFYDNREYAEKLEHSLKPSEVRAEDYEAMFYAGGHGTMWDFPDNGELTDLAAVIYGQGGVIAAVCHGPAAFVNLKLPDGRYLVEGKRINCFTNSEERDVGLDRVVPFLLETKLRERGARFEHAPDWGEFVVVCDRVVTGQNPQSATGVGEAILKELE